MESLIVLLTLALLPANYAIQEDIVLRPNYGVMFRPERPLFNSNAYWRATFAVPFHRPTLPKVWKLDCRDFILDNVKYPNQSQPPTNLYHLHDPALEICRSFRTIVAEFNEQVREFESKINTTERSISRLLHPNMRVDPKDLAEKLNRYKRGAPLAFIGELEKSIFGLATTEDVITLANHVIHIESFLNESSTARKSYRGHLDSFVKTATKRFDVVNKQIIRNHNVINETLGGI
jgi:hypothetical protein